MCGVNGIFTFNKTDNRDCVKAMNSALQHRGPDDEGVWYDDNIVLGQRRLMIIDLSDAGHQPMTTPDGRYTMVFNGEVYNFEDIRKELDYPFISKTDSEVVLAAWQKWGSGAVERFNGMFAFAVWDAKENRLTLIRDRLGIKPLYWAKRGDSLIFSSEIRGLLASGMVRKELDPDSVVDYLRYQTVQTPNTILNDVFMLQPGSLLEIGLNYNKPVISRYWAPNSQNFKTSEPQDYNDIKEHVRNLFYSSVKRRLVSDVPFGAFLSGGIDSSAIVGAMAKVSNSTVKTFNISFAEEEFSEAKYAGYIANMHGTEHHEIKLSPSDFLSYLPDALKSMDHPSGDGPNTWLVSKVTKEAGITMALSGLGGDELFAGYPIFKRMMSMNNKQWLWNIPAGLRKQFANMLTKVRPGVASLKVKELLSMNDYDFATAFSVSRQALMDDQLKGLLNRDVLPEHNPVRYLKELFQVTSLHSFPAAAGDKRGADILSNVSTGELTTYMQNVLLRDSDQMSMAHALEVRVPFLDHELVEYLLSLPDSVKYPVTPKKLLVDSLNDLLPDYIVNRPKMGFTFPWRDWLKNELHDFADERLNSIASREYFNYDEVMLLWKRFKQDDPNVTFSRLWPLVVLEEWMTNEG